MRRLMVCAIAACLAVSALPAKNRGVIDTSQSPHVKMRSVDLDAVNWTSGFWADRFQMVRDDGLPRLWEVMQDPMNAANLVNLRIAAGAQGKFHGNNWSDGDVYKAVETMAAVYLRTKNPKLDRTMDEAIAIIAKAQTPEGYIGSHTQIGGRKRWGALGLHELYNMGHLITAACVHYRVTGKENFLDVAKRTADYLYVTFKPRPKELAHFCFNPSQIMAVVELYRITRDSLKTTLPGGTRIDLAQETAYPWQGLVKIKVNQTIDGDFALIMRIPGWAQNPKLTINGKLDGIALRPGSYAEVRRRWSAGDKVELDLGMEVRLIEPNPKVEEARNQVAVARGPLVYCLESADLPVDVKLDEVAIPLTARFAPRYDARLLKGLTVLEGDARVTRADDWSGQLYRSIRLGTPQNIKLRLIPYYAWGNRGLPYMTVWLPLAR